MGIFNKDNSDAKASYQKLKDVPEGDFPDGPMEVTDADFADVVKRYPMVIIDCWAPWCGPCKMIGPIVDDLAKKHKGDIVYGKLNTDSNQQTAMKYGIMSIPTLMVFKNGELDDQIVGAMPKPILEKEILKRKD